MANANKVSLILLCVTLVMCISDVFTKPYEHKKSISNKLHKSSQRTLENNEHFKEPDTKYIHPDKKTFVAPHGHHRPHIKRTIFLGHHFLDSLARAASKQTSGSVRNPPPQVNDKSSKKSNIKETYKVHGSSGNMHIKADMKEQFIRSENGPLDVFIENKSNDKPKKSKSQVHLISDVTGVRKSIVISD